MRSPDRDGGVAVLVWEGMGRGYAAQVLLQLATSPQSEHERYLVEYVIPVLHGVDIGAPLPSLQRIGTIEP